MSGAPLRPWPASLRGEFMNDPLPPAAALALAADLLAAKGFVLTARNERGDSLYLRRPDSPWHLRLSNHRRTARQRQRRRDILTSLILDRPRSRAQVADLVGGALRTFEAAARRADP